MDRFVKRKSEQNEHGWGYMAVISVFILDVIAAIVIIMMVVWPPVAAQVGNLMGNSPSPSLPPANGGNLRANGLQSLTQNSASATSRPTLVPATPSAAPSATPSPTATSTPVTDVVSADPPIGWQAYGPMVNGQPAMAQATLMLDSQQPGIGTTLVRMDLSKLQLHIEPGFLEPSHSATVQNALPNLGLIPPADRTRLIAAFNGGFKSADGKYGMVINNVMLLPPWPWIATVAIYKDGQVQLGTWGKDLFPGDPNIIALRQNCPPILESGQIDPRVYVDAPSLWGNTLGNSPVTWRTGLGITKDGRYLIYAVGSTTVARLAQALQNAGAYNAMQLDINRPFAHFVTYNPFNNPKHLIPVRLLDQMTNDPTLYVKAHSRDFFYLTAR